MFVAFEFRLDGAVPTTRVAANVSVFGDLGMEYESRLEVDFPRLIFNELFHFVDEIVGLPFGGSHPEI